MSVFNFSAGPAMLPSEVMKQAQSEFINWQNTGSSVMEISHRSKLFIELAHEAEAGLKKLLNIDDTHSVLFMHGGGRGQFAAVPMNLLGNKSAHYVQTGSWSKSAYAEGCKFGSVTNQEAVELNQQGFQFVKPMNEWSVNSDDAYLHYCPNETVDGIEIFDTPNFDIPVVADMSSTILSRPLDMDNYDLIYAGAQKNIGPSGLAIVVIKKELLASNPSHAPSIFDYKLTAEKESMFNTPPTFAIYLAKLVFDWLLERGGLAAQEKINITKAEHLYKAIDNSSFYQNTVATENRSRMNVPFHLADTQLDKLFLEQAEANGLMALKGHRLVGGMRASIYNAMQFEGIKTLVEFMSEFERTHG